MQVALNSFFSTAALIFVLMGSTCFAVEPISSNDIGQKIKQALGGDANSALWLSRFYEKKVGMEKEAKKWLITAAKLGHVVAIVELGYEKPYVAETDIKCGRYKAHITTSCRLIDKVEGQPLCYAQHIELQLDSEKKDFFLFNPTFRNDLMIAARATCVNNGEENFLIIESTNFGSGRTCTDCEREDYFDESASYVGSSSGKSSSRIVYGYKQVAISLQKKLRRLLRDEKTHKQSFEINRYPIINGGNE